MSLDLVAAVGPTEEIKPTSEKSVWYKVIDYVWFWNLTFYIEQMCRGWRPKKKNVEIF